MLTKEELSEFDGAVKILSDECSKYPFCTGCVLSDLCNYTPSKWRIPEEDNEVLQAAAVVKAVCSKFPDNGDCIGCPLYGICSSDVWEWKVVLDD